MGVILLLRLHHIHHGSTTVRHSAVHIALCNTAVIPRQHVVVPQYKVLLLDYPDIPLHTNISLIPWYYLPWQYHSTMVIHWQKCTAPTIMVFCYYGRIILAYHGINYRGINVVQQYGRKYPQLPWYYVPCVNTMVSTWYSTVVENYRPKIPWYYLPR